MNEFSPILSDRLQLQLPGKRHIPAILAYYRENRDFLVPFEPLRPMEFYHEDFWYQQIDKNLIDFNYDQALRLFLFKKSHPDRIIGSVNFTQITRGATYSCFLGYSLAEQEQGQGYMTEALRTVIPYVFGQWNLHRIGASYMPRNQRSSNVLRRLGFVVEGYARDYLLINGQWEDHILTSLTNPYWQPEA